MELFQVVGNKVVPHDTTLLISPFKEIYEQNDKDLSSFKFAYIEFMCSYKKSNPFIGYKDEERPMKILDKIIPDTLPELITDIPNDLLVQESIKVYNELQLEASPALRLYNSALGAADKIQDFFLTVDLNSKNFKTGALLYKPADITRALKDVNDIIKTLAAIRDNVYKELAESAKGKAGREINYFEKSKFDK